MEPIVSRSEFPDEDEDSRPVTDHQIKAGEEPKITRSPTSDARPIGASQAPTEAPPPPSTFDYCGATIDGRYLVERQLGEGGMGVVYQCRHTIIDKKVAIKVLRADLARNEEVTERFLNEARSASSIGNPHIIDISDFGRLPDGTPYFVMEFLTGISMAEIVDSGLVMEPGRLGHIALQLCEGLAAAHAAGIIHRDLKPDNIFLIDQGSRKDFVKILDFGIAKATHVSSKLTQAGQVFGTPHYMSPEQANGAEVDARSDIYAVGVMLYELSTGQLPFDADNFMAILTQHMYKDPTPPSEIEGLAPLTPGLEEVILKCLAKAPAERYQNLVELKSDLRGVFVDLLPATEVSSATDAYSTPELYARQSSKPQIPASARTTAPIKTKKHLSLYTAIGVSAALFAGSLVWFLGAKEQETSPKPVDKTAAEAPLAPAPPPAVEPSTQDALIKKPVAIAVYPPSAHVYQGDEDLGTSPVMLEVDDQPVELLVKAKGYTNEELTVDGSINKLQITLKKEKRKVVVPRAPRSAAPRRSPTPSPTSTPGVVDPW